MWHINRVINVRMPRLTATTLLQPPRVLKPSLNNSTSLSRTYSNKNQFMQQISQLHARNVSGLRSLIPKINNTCRFNLFQQVKRTATDMSYKNHSHSTHWALERYLSIGLAVLFPAAFVWDSPTINYAIAIILGAHIHLGLEGVVTDYARPRVIGSIPAFLSINAVRLSTALMFASLLYLTYNDPCGGIIGAVKLIAQI